MQALNAPREASVRNELVELRELTTRDEIREYFRIRQHVYEHSGYFRPGGPELDIDAFDRHCRFAGAFLGPQMVGGARMILPEGQEPHGALVDSLAAEIGLTKPPRPTTYHAQQDFDVDSTVDLARRQGLVLVEFGRTVCLPEHRKRGLGMALVHTVHGMGLRHGVDVAVAVAPPHLRTFYEQFGCRFLESRGVGHLPGLDTEALLMVLDLRKLAGPFRMAYTAADHLRRHGRVLLCPDKECLLQHRHQELPRAARPAPRPPAATYDWNPPEAYPTRPVDLHDETLRDGLQSPSVGHPDLDGKLRVLHRIAGLGIPSANLGLPGAGPRFQEDARRLVQEIADARLPVAPTLAGRTVRADIDPIAEVAQATGVRVEAGLFLGSSAIRHVCEEWDLDRLVRLTEEAVTHAVRCGLDVMFVTEDTVRARPEVLRRLYLTALECGAKRICLCDTVGHATPSGVRRLVAFVRGVVGPEVRLDWHGHSDRGLALANTLAALEAGVDRVHGTALGIGERAGNTPMEGLLRSLHTLGGRPLDPLRLSEYLCTVSRACGVALPEVAR